MQYGEVVCRYFAKLFLAFYVGGGLESGGKKRTVYAEASGEVGQRISLKKTGFVAGSDFRRALL